MSVYILLHVTQSVMSLKNEILSSNRDKQQNTDLNAPGTERNVKLSKRWKFVFNKMN